jgi:AraC-like DNA-binding protein
MESDLDRITDWEPFAEQAGYRVQALAESLHRTPQSLRNYVRKRWKVSTKTWLADLQMRAARRHLVAHSRPKEIAQHLGFQHATHFSRAFRSVHGTSPRAFLIDQASESSERVSKLV